jgi:hypothetical protein
MFKKAKIASLAFFGAMLLGQAPSGKAMKEEEEWENSCNIAPVPSPSILVNEILYKIKRNEAFVVKQVGEMDSLSLASCVFDFRRGSICSVTFIEDDCFRESTLRKITIPRTVKALGDRCFYGCHLLVAVSFETDSQLECIGEESFRSSALISITVLKGVKKIGKRCFQECQMKSISFESPSQLRILRKESFREAYLESICLPHSIEVLEEGCFYECPFLTSVSFEPNSQLQDIEDHAFCYCRSLSNISFEMELQLQSIEKWAFAGSSLRKVTIPRQLEILRYGCFSDCKSLESVLFEPYSQLRRIEAWAFMNTGLRRITIPRTVKILERVCFSDCSFLTSVSFETDSQLQEIEERVFTFSSLKTIIIPHHVEVLGEECFSHCPFLREVSFEADSRLQSIGMWAFEYLSLKAITLPKSIKSLRMGCFCGCCCHLEVLFEEGSQLRTVENGAFALSRQLKEHGGRPSYLWNKRPGRFCLPERVVEIGLSIGYENIIIRRAPEEVFIGCHFDGHSLGKSQSYVFSLTAKQLSPLLNERGRDWRLTMKINSLSLADYFERLDDCTITVRLIEDGSSLQGDTVLRELRRALSSTEHVSIRQMIPFPSEEKPKEKCLLL